MIKFFFFFTEVSLSIEVASLQLSFRSLGLVALRCEKDKDQCKVYMYRIVSM